MIKASKATGMDYLPTKVLKISSYLIAPSLTAILNMSLRSGIYRVYQKKGNRTLMCYRAFNI